MLAIQEIGEEIELVDSNQTGHHVHSQFLSTPRTTHLQAVMKILKYLKKALGEISFIQIIDILE